MQTSNGRTINVVKLLRNRHVLACQSPYNNNGSKKRVANPDPISLSDDKISRCLNTIEIALRRSNQEEALAAVSRAFLTERKSAITIDSHLEELGLRDAIVDVLNIHNVFTIDDLVLMESTTLNSLAGLNESDVSTVVLAVESLGFRFSTPDDDA